VSQRVVMDNVHDPYGVRTSACLDLEGRSGSRAPFDSIDRQTSKATSNCVVMLLAREGDHVSAASEMFHWTRRSSSDLPLASASFNQRGCGPKPLHLFVPSVY